MCAKGVMLILCASAAAAAADVIPAVHGPVTGFVYDAQARAIRPMLGLPGAAYLGAPVVSALEAASVSPDGSTVVGIQAGRLVVYTGINNAAPPARRVPAAISGADRFAWAPSSAAAVVYSSTQAQVINLSGTPEAGAPISLAGIPGELAALAFDGSEIIAGSSGGIYVVTAQGAIERLASAASPSAIALAGSDLYFADQQANQIWQVSRYASQPAALLFAADDSIVSPVGLQLSADGLRLYVANAGNLKLAIYGVATRTLLRTLALSTAPAGLQRFGDPSVFLLNGATASRQPLYVLSDRGTDQAVYFVPNPNPAESRPIHYRPADGTAQ